MSTATKEKALFGNKTEAFGADPSKSDTYKFKYKVVNIDDLIPSHTDRLTPNPKYLSVLQPRLRDRSASRLQIERMASNLNPRALLHDAGFLDTGPMIIGPDNMVESGNGRVLALRKSLADFPEKYRLYKILLENRASDYGFNSDEIAKIDNPVLVRERITPVNRVNFAAEANTSKTMAMSPFEQALQDASRISDQTINTMQVGEEQTIDQAETNLKNHLK